MLDKARYIVVEGPIGSGKTALAQRLAEHLSAYTLFEQPAANPFLNRFYQDTSRWALPAQLHFLFQRIDQLALCKTSLTEHQRVISDFLFAKDPLFARLNLKEEELNLYLRIFESVQPPSPPQPDLVIYLQAKAETLFERLQRRGKEQERHITQSYLAGVNERYTRFFYDYDSTPLFIVDTDHLNPVENEDDFILLLKHLRNMRSYREFFGYAG